MLLEEDERLVGPFITSFKKSRVPGHFQHWDLVHLLLPHEKGISGSTSLFELIPQ